MEDGLGEENEDGVCGVLGEIVRYGPTKQDEGGLMLGRVGYNDGKHKDEGGLVLGRMGENDATKKG